MSAADTSSFYRGYVKVVFLARQISELELISNGMANLSQLPGPKPTSYLVWLWQTLKEYLDMHSTFFDVPVEDLHSVTRLVFCLFSMCLSQGARFKGGSGASDFLFPSIFKSTFINKEQEKLGFENIGFEQGLSFGTAPPFITSEW